MAGDEVKVNTKNRTLDLALDSMNSSRLRIGGRLNHKMGSNNAMYIGLAWQREFNGMASGALADKDIISPSIKGNTGIMELGAIGSVGKKKGAGLNLNFNFKF